MKSGEFDEKFDSGDDISSSVDRSKARRPNASKAQIGDNAGGKQVAGDPRTSVAMGETPADMAALARDVLDQPYKP
ncbi:MAG TPA: hypothetical protein PKA55_17950 [Rhodoblastus sp.]|nr:hypothetical protein [Rhodoblastus sp.]